MTRYLLVFLLLFAIAAKAQVVDSLKTLLRFTKGDTARISLYIQLAEEAEDSMALAYSDSAVQIINTLMHGAGGKMEITLNDYLSEAYYYKSLYLANAEAYDSSIYYLNKAMQPAVDAGNKKQQALILNDIGVCTYFKNDIPGALDYLKRSLAVREELKDEIELRNAYNNMAFICKEIGLIENSLDYNFKSLALAEKQKNEPDIATSLNNIGQVYHQQLVDYNKALTYYGRSLAIRQKLNNKKDIALIKNNLGSVYGDMGNYAEAIRNYKESLALRREVNHKYGVVQTLSNLAFNYIEIKDYESAKNALAESMELNKSLQDMNLQEAIHYNYARLYDTLHMPDSAVYHSLRSYNICISLGNPLDISKSALLLSSLYQKQGNYNAALTYYKEYKKMQDSILNNNIKIQGIKSEMEYEYLKKKKDSDILYDQQLAQKNLYTWLLVVLLVATSVIGYVLYKRYRLKQQLKEVEIRNKIASDLHDDVGSTLSSIRMYSDIVKQQINQPQKATALLDKISSNSKEMIENMSDIVWMIKPGNDDFKSIENRMLNFAAELCEPAGINFEFNKNTQTETLHISMELRRDVYLIFKEAVNNAVKYAACKNIYIALSTQNQQLQLSITDDGKGFNTATATNGNGLSNIAKRSQMHKGSFTIQSTPGSGTIINTVFPI